MEIMKEAKQKATHWERGQFIEFISPVRSEMTSRCLNWKISCDDHSSLSSASAVQI